MPELLENTDTDGQLKNPKIYSADIRPGNLCNLSCRMCSPVASSKWVKEWSQLNYKWFEPTSDQLKVYDWFKDKKTLESLAHGLKSTRHIHFGGGEPLFIQETFELLEFCIQNNFSENIHLSYNTNLTKIPGKVKEYWSQFKSVDLLVSLDGYDQVNDYIRSGSEFSVIDTNLKFVDENFKQLNLNEVSIMCTVQIYNIFALEKLFSYTKSFQNISPFPELTPLYMPDELSIQQLSSELKEMAINQIDSLVENCKGSLTTERLHSYRHRINDLNEIKNFLMKPPEKNLKQELRDMTIDLDHQKKMSLKDVNSTLYDWICQD